MECVPNLSEGRRESTIDACARAVATTHRVRLLDRTSDLDHDRSVLTFAGDADPVLEAMQRVAAQAIARIDMRRQHGLHPRIGALDVVPFVPLGDTPMAACVEQARVFGAWLADRYAIPVYLYARAASRPDRRILADIRRPAFEGLATALAAPDGAPDMGPRRPHPTAGAVAVGARPPLVAWNIQLDTSDVGIARRIAHAIRERDGGLRSVQALGIHLAAFGCTQVSMNLLDVATTPMWRVLERVTELAMIAGTTIRDTELIGLAPIAAFLDTADHQGIPASLPIERRVAAAVQLLRIRGGDPDMALELRWAAGRQDPDERQPS